MIDVVLVKFLDTGKVYQFQPDGLDVKRGDGCIVETQRGVEYGIIVSNIRQIDESELRTQPKKIMRAANPKDEEKLKELKNKEAHAAQVCLERIKQRNLPMKLIRVCFLFDMSKAIFYFTADGRIDFRGLVKDLAYQFRTRIEMRQIGVRDETKMLGGIGCCGLTVCCSTFLSHFDPVSIKMAKNQNLSLITSKISGLCGRLMCCLVYENDTYAELHKMLPPIGSKVKTQHGTGIVVALNILQESVRVELSEGDLKTVHYKNLDVLEIPKIPIIPDETPDQLDDLNIQENGSTLDSGFNNNNFPRDNDLNME